MKRNAPVLLAAMYGSVLGVREIIPWYEQLSMWHFPHFAAIDMDGHRLIPAIKNLKADYMLIEFYAPWCPHCQHFAPEYERLALTINRFNNLTVEHKGKAPRILSGTVDCVKYEDTCESWNIQGYPTMLWGLKKDWVAGAHDKLWEVKVETHSAEAVAQWIDVQIHLGLDPSPISRQEMLKMLHANSPDRERERAAAEQGTKALLRPHQADTWDMQLGAALLLHNSMRQLVEAASEGSLSDIRRDSLVNLVDLLQRRFPDKEPQTTCRTSLAALAAEIHNDTSWEALQDPAAFSRLSPDLVEGNWTFCNTEWEAYGRLGWRGCKPTFPGKRGFTCGLWTMFHAVASRTDDASAAKDLNAMHGAILNFFECEDCRNHFATIPVLKEDTISRRAVQLWWWRAHNLVNARVKGVEEEYNDGDPAYPKVQFPTAAECPLCRRQSKVGSYHRSFLAVRQACKNLTGTYEVRSANQTSKSASSVVLRSQAGCTGSAVVDGANRTYVISGANATINGSIGAITGLEGAYTLTFKNSMMWVQKQDVHDWDLDQVVAFLERYYGK